MIGCLPPHAPNHPLVFNSNEIHPCLVMYLQQVSPFTAVIESFLLYELNDIHLTVEKKACENGDLNTSQVPSQSQETKTVSATVFRPPLFALLGEKEKNALRELASSGPNTLKRRLASVPASVFISLQQLFVHDVVAHSLSLRFPPSHSYRKAVLKYFVTIFEEALLTRNSCAPDGDRSGDKRTQAQDETQGGEEEGWELYEELVDRHVEMMMPVSSDSFFFKTFFVPHSETVKKSDGLPGRESCDKLPSVLRLRAVPVRVASQFHNVGLSLWPASFVLTLVLNRELSLLGRGPPQSFDETEETQLLRPVFTKGSSSREVKERKRIRIVELGAGTGITASGLECSFWSDAAVAQADHHCNYCGPADHENGEKENKQPVFAAKDSSSVNGVLEQYTLTDYQGEILENCEMNMKLAGIDSFSAMKDLREGHPSSTEPDDVQKDEEVKISERNFVSVQLLDWTELEKNHSIFSALQPNVLVAADVVYDRPVLPHLVQTCLLFLRCQHISLPHSVPHHEESKFTIVTRGQLGPPLDATEEGIIVPCYKKECEKKKEGDERVCIIVSTQRNEATFAEFVELLHAEDCCVESYSLAQVLPSLAPLQDSDNSKQVSPACSSAVGPREEEGERGERDESMETWRRMQQELCSAMATLTATSSPSRSTRSGDNKVADAHMVAELTDRDDVTDAVQAAVRTHRNTTFRNGSQEGEECRRDADEVPNNSCSCSSSEVRDTANQSVAVSIRGPVFLGSFFVEMTERVVVHRITARSNARKKKS